MRRRLTKLVVFLLLGAIVNVAVAWGCAMRDPWYNREARLATEDDTRWWHAHVPEDFPATPWKVAENRAFGVSKTMMLEQFDSQLETLPNLMVTRRRAGLPMPALEGSIWSDFRKGQVRKINRHLMEGLNDRPQVPLFPLWPGFAINTIFYAAILWFLTLGPGTARRMIRRKRRHCIKCGYDLSGAEHEACPECGLGRGVVEAVRRN